MQIPTSSYRYDIDGLRAFSVLSVVFFHFRPVSIPGGFSGVDVFFVISGYVITSNIIRYIYEYRFSMKIFLINRIRRLFPSLVTVLLFVFSASFFILLPSERAKLGADITASALSASNVLSWNEQGYFDRAAIYKPLLHLWSLGVEEQFYLTWPFIILLLVRFSKHWNVFLGLLGTISFVLCVVLSFSASQKTAFYAPFTRAWEFVIGASLLFCDRNILQRWKNWMSIAGALFLVSAFWALSVSVTYPGWMVLLPTLGAALLIGGGSDSVVNRFILQNRMLVGIGRISYAIYLWHWPLVVFYHYAYGPHQLNLLKSWIFTIFIVVISYLTVRYIEEPLRRSRKDSTVIILCGVMGLIGLGGIAMWYARGWPTSSSNVAVDINKISLAVDNGIFQPSAHMHVTKIEGVTVGIIGDNIGKPILFTGDSLIFQWAAAVERAFMEGRLAHTVIFVSAPSCRPWSGIGYGGSFPFCKKMPQVADAIIKEYHVRRVILGVCWQAQGDDWQNFLTERVQTFKRNGIDVSLVLPSPVDNRMAPVNLVSRSLTSVKINLDRIRNGIPVSELNQSQQGIVSTLTAIAHKTDATLFDPMPEICDGNTCLPLMLSGEPKFADDKHLRPVFVWEKIKFLNELLKNP